MSVGSGGFQCRWGFQTKRLEGVLKPGWGMERKEGIPCGSGLVFSVGIPPKMEVGRKNGRATHSETTNLQVCAFSSGTSCQVSMAIWPRCPELQGSCWVAWYQKTCLATCSLRKRHFAAKVHQTPAKNGQFVVADLLTWVRNARRQKIVNLM